MNIFRRKFLLDKKLQFSLLFLIGGIPAIWSILLAFATFYKLIDPDSVRAYIYPDDYYRIFFQYIVLGLLVLVVYLFTVGVIITHRIVGPIWKLQEELTKYHKGESIRPLNFRKKDAFKNLPKLINKLLDPGRIKKP